MRARRAWFVVAVAVAVASLLATRIAAQAGFVPQQALGVLTGEVVTNVQGTSSPVARAVVRLQHVESRARHSAVTDTSGQFVIQGVLPGRYLLSASSPAYVTTYYGAQRFNQAGVAVVVAEGQRLDGLRITLLRGGVIAGTVRTESGRPASGAGVMLHRGGGTPGLLVTQALVGSDSGTTVTLTDAAGGFRFFGLPPGRYTVSAAGLPGAGAPGLVRTYLPGTLFPSEATFVDIGPGEERTGVDITLRRTSGQRVAGQIVGPGAEGAQLRVDPVGPFRVDTAGPDGRFTISSVPQGSYLVRARAVVAGPAGTEEYRAEATFVVGDPPVAGVLLNMAPSLETHVAGRVLLEPGSDDVLPRTMVRLRSRETWHSAEAAVEPDRTFRIGAVPPGRYDVEMTFDGQAAAGAAWRAVSFIADGQDVLDTGLTVIDRGIDGATVTVTQATQQLRGTLRGSAALPPTILTMLVFPEDRRFWTRGSRRIKAVRPDTDGTYRFEDLPSGSYFAIALYDPDPASIFDPVYLSSLADVSMRISIAPGEQKTLDVQVAGP